MFFDTFVKLCEEKGVKPSRALTDAGVPKSAYSYWRTEASFGNDAKQTNQNAVKLAQYFGVNRGTIANWEQGLAAISLPMAMRWFTCCGVSVARYMDACIHPGLLEHLEDDLSGMEKRQILIDAMMECSSYEIDALLYMRYGDHGSDHIGVLTEVLANLHTPLKDRVSVCRMVSGNYEIAQATGTDPDPNGTAPKMEILYQAQDAGTEAAMRSNDSYTVNPNNISG